MSFSSTATRTYTVADVRKVVDMFGADLDLAAQYTGLWSQRFVGHVIADVKAFAEMSFLRAIHLVLEDSTGTVIRAKRYDIFEGDATWSTELPGGIRWPRTPGGELTVVLEYSDTWDELTATEQRDFKRTLNCSIAPTRIDTSYPGMIGSRDRGYSSSGYGMARTRYIRY